MTESQAIEAINKLVEEYRNRCLWHISRSYTPTTLDSRLRILSQIARQADRVGFVRARELMDWLSPNSSEKPRNARASREPRLTTIAESAGKRSHMSLPSTVRVVEVGPRDGLQNEAVTLDTADKLTLLRQLAGAGFADIEAASFVQPARIPQLADAAEVFAQIRSIGPVAPARWWALVPNRRGLDRALEAGCRAVALFTAASETFNQRNIGMTIAESLGVFSDFIAAARAAGCSVRAYVSAAFHCPYEGPIAPATVLPIVRKIRALDVDEISLGDTIGHAVPTEVERLLDALQSEMAWSQGGSGLPESGPPSLAMHFHNTRGAALANVLASLQRGIDVFDSSIGGAGGCPFAPGAAGNLPTEDLLYLLHGMGIATGVNLPKAADASRFLESRLGHPLPGRFRQSLSGAGG